MELIDTFLETDVLENENESSNPDGKPCNIDKSEYSVFQQIAKSDFEVISIHNVLMS